MREIVEGVPKTDRYYFYMVCGLHPAGSILQLCWIIQSWFWYGLWITSCRINPTALLNHPILILIWFVDYILQDQSYSFVESSNPDFGQFQTLPFQSRAAEKKQIFEIFHLQWWKTTCKHTFSDECDRHTVFQGRDSSPFTCKLKELVTKMKNNIRYKSYKEG